MSKAASKPSTKQNAWTKPLKQTQPPPPGLGPPSSSDDVDAALRERFLNVMVNMIGLKVTMTLKTDGGVQLEGILHTATPFPVMADTLRAKYMLKATMVVSGTPSKTIEPNATVLIKMEDVVQVHCKSIKLAQNGNNNFTDTEISDGGTAERRGLQQAGSAWTSAPEARATGSAAGDIKGSIGGWDQFKANEDLFNVKASYDENLYTTELDKSNINKNDMRKAEKMAKEIEKTASSNMHIAEERNQVVQGDFDEEDRYSGVLKRKPSAPTKKAPPAMNYAAAASKPSSESSAAPPGFKGDTKKEETKEDAAASPNEEPKKEETPAASEEKEAETKEGDQAKEEKPKSKLSATAKSFTFNPTAKTFTPSQPAQPPPAVHAPMPMQPHPAQFMPPHAMQPGMVPMMNPPYPRYPYGGMDQPSMPPHTIPTAPSTAGSQPPSDVRSNDGDSQKAGTEDGSAGSGAANNDNPESNIPPQHQIQQQQQQPPPQHYPGMPPPPQQFGMPPPPPHGYPVHPASYMHPGVPPQMYRPGYGPVMVRPPFAGGYHGVPPPPQGYYYEEPAADGNNNNYGNNNINNNGGRGGRGRGGGGGGRHQGGGRGGGRGGRNNGRGGRGRGDNRPQQPAEGDDDDDKASKT